MQEHNKIIQFNNSLKDICVLRTFELEIPSSYKKINELTSYQYIKNGNLKKQTREIFRIKIRNLYLFDFEWWRFYTRKKIEKIE